MRTRLVLGLGTISGLVFLLTRLALLLQQNAPARGGLVTIGAVLLIVVPVAIGVAILASLVQPRRWPGSRR